MAKVQARISSACEAAAAIVLILACAAGAHAQDAAAQMKARQQQGLDVSRAIEAAPGATTPYALPVPEITLLTTKDGTEATAVIGRSDPFWGVRATFKTPIGKEAAAEAAPLSLTGLANQASVDFAVLHKRIFKNADNIDQLRLDFCEKRGIPSNRCSDQAFSGDERQQFLDFGIHGLPAIAAAHIQVGGKSFEYVETGSAAKQTRKETSVLAGASYAWLFLGSRSIVSVGVDAARDYQASKDTTLLCQPLATDVAGTERCDTRIIGTPTPTEKVTIALDFRKVYARDQLNPAKPGEGGKPPTPAAVPVQSVPVVGLGVQLRVQAADGADTLWSLEVPVHFLQRKPEKGSLMSLNGGASAGWHSKTGFVARVFIGPAFGLIGNDIR